MTLKTTQLVVGTTAALAVSALNVSPYNKTAVLIATDSGTLYVGGSDVTTSTGIAVSTTPLSITLGQSGEDLYVIATQTTTGRVFYPAK